MLNDRVRDFLQIGQNLSSSSSGSSMCRWIFDIIEGSVYYFFGRCWIELGDNIKGLQIELQNGVGFYNSIKLLKNGDKEAI